MWAQFTCLFVCRKKIHRFFCVCRCSLSQLVLIHPDTLRLCRFVLGNFHSISFEPFFSFFFFIITSLHWFRTQFPRKRRSPFILTAGFTFHFEFFFGSFFFFFFCECCWDSDKLAVAEKSVEMGFCFYADMSNLLHSFAIDKVWKYLFFIGILNSDAWLFDYFKWNLFLHISLRRLCVPPVMTLLIIKDIAKFERIPFFYISLG